jgi:hypothetical protein
MFNILQHIFVCVYGTTQRSEIINGVKPRNTTEAIVSPFIFYILLTVHHVMILGK